MEYTISKVVWILKTDNGLAHWVLVDSDTCPPAIQREIALQVVYYGVEETRLFRASNGHVYRWSDL